MSDAKKAKSSRTQLLARLDELKAEIAASDERESERIGRIAVQAGLADLELTDRELSAAFAKLKDLALADDFRAVAAKPLPARAPVPAAAPAAATASQKSAA